jgi:hypothetical protein
MGTERLDLVLATIMADPAKLDPRNPPKNWCILLRQNPKDPQGILYRLGKYDTGRGKWFDEFMTPVGVDYPIYRETRFMTLNQIDSEKEEIIRYAALAQR